MAQNTSHEPRNSVCKVLSQDPSECVAVCRTLPLCAFGSRLVVKVICKENKEQKGKRKYHAGGFPQWFGSCSLMSTLYVWFPACWAPMVAERLFSWSPPVWEFSYTQEGRPVSGPSHTAPQASSQGAILAPVSQ